MRTKFFIITLLSLILIGCKTSKVSDKLLHYNVSEVSDYNQRVSFLCDSLKIIHPHESSWNQLFTVGDRSVNYAKYIWYDLKERDIKITVYDTDSIDTVILTIEAK